MLPTCFPHSPPHSPTKPGAANRIGTRRVTHPPADSVAELSGGTGRQCGGVWRSCREALRECRGAVGGHWDSPRGPDHRASPTLMADLQQLQQQDPVLRPVQATGRIRIDCICVAFCICGFVCKWLYIPALYSRFGFSVSVTTSLFS